MTDSTFTERFNRWKNGESYWNIVGKPIPKYGDGKNYSGYNVLHVKQGSLGDNIDAQVDLPDNSVVITGDASKNKNRMYSSAFDPSGIGEFVNTATLGGLNNLSPTLWIRRGYDAVNGKLTANSWFNGNNGIVSNEFALDHPIISGAVNMAGDVAAFGLGNITKKLELYKNLNPFDNEYTRNIVYYNKEPFGYTDLFKTVKSIAKDYITGQNRSYIDAPWEDNLFKRNYPSENEIKARIDAWRMYNKFPLKYNTFVPAERYPGSYTARADIDLLSYVLKSYPEKLIESQLSGTPIKYPGYDFVNGSGGAVNLTATNLFNANLDNSKIYGGIILTLDLWDLHPLQRANSLKKLLNLPTSLFRFFNTKIGSKISDRVSRLEAGKIFGAKPFNVINDVPVTYSIPTNGIKIAYRGFPEELLNTTFGKSMLSLYPQTNFHINPASYKYFSGDNQGFDELVNNETISILQDNLSKLKTLNIAKPSYKNGKDSIQGFVSTFRPMLYNTLLKKGYHTNSMDNMLTQLAWESNYGKSNNAKSNYNYGGVKSGSDYAKYNSPEDFVDHYVDLIHDRYPNAFNSNDLNTYAKALKLNGYYEDSLSHYSSSLNSMKSLRLAIEKERLGNLSKYNSDVSFDLVMSQPQDAIRSYKQNIVLDIPTYTPTQQTQKQMIYPSYVLLPNKLPNIMDVYSNMINGRPLLNMPGQ